MSKDQVLCFSFRVCSVYAPLPEVREQRALTQGVHMCVRRGVCGSVCVCVCVFAFG